MLAKLTIRSATRSRAERRRLTARSAEGAQRGFALPIVLGSLVVIGGMLAGVFMSATMETRLGDGSVQSARAFDAAELGLNATVSNWSTAQMAALGIGSTVVTVFDSATSRQYIDTVRVTKLSNNSFWVTSVGHAVLGGSSAARRRTNMAVRVNYPALSVLGALTVRGAITISGSSFINGYDTQIAGWNCPPSETPLPGVSVANTSDVNLNGCNNLSCLAGVPQISANPAASDTSTYFVFGDVDWAMLTSMATIRYSGSQTLNQIQPSSVNGVCNRTDSRNWGETARASPAPICSDYFPIIHFTGATANVNITGGRGQGIILVDGDLSMTGGFTFNGPVIVRGRFSTYGTGAHVNGAVMAGNVDLEQNAVAGNAIVNYSSCAIDAALAGAGVIRRVTQRAWADLH
jgi:hypothetical protein